MMNEAKQNFKHQNSDVILLFTV